MNNTSAAFALKAIKNTIEMMTTELSPCISLNLWATNEKFKVPVSLYSKPIPNNSNKKPNKLRTTEMIAARKCSNDCPNVNNKNEASNNNSNKTEKINKTAGKNDPITPTVKNKIKLGK